MQPFATHFNLEQRPVHHRQLLESGVRLGGTAVLLEGKKAGNWELSHMNTWQ